MENVKEKNSKNSLENSLEHSGDDITDDLEDFEDFMDEEFNDAIDTNSTLTAEFSDGYSLRNLVEYLRLTNYNGTFIFTEDQILYEQANGKETILNSLVIDAHELTYYSMQSRTSQITMRVSLSAMRQRTKNIGKKDRAVISKMANDTNMYLEIYSQNSASTGDNPNFYVISTLQSEIKPHKKPEYERKKRPNCTVYQGDFAKFCTSFISVKCSYVTVHAFKMGILFKGMSSTNKAISFKEFGKCCGGESSENVSTTTIQEKNAPTTIIKPKNSRPRLIVMENGEIDSIKMQIDTIKGLAKLNNLSTTGTIKMYFEKEKPLLLICNIGTYGELSVYLR